MKENLNRTVTLSNRRDHLKGGEEKVIWNVLDMSVKEALENFDFELNRGYTTLEVGQGKKIFVKFFREKGLLGYLRNIISPRGKKEFWLANKLTILGIPTPKCLGYGITDTGSFSVWEHVDGDTYSRRFRNTSDRSWLIKMLAVFLRELKSKGIRHDDLHLDNVMIYKDQIMLVDLHKVRIKKTINQEDEINNLSHALNMVYHEMSEEEKKIFFNWYGAPHLLDPVEERLRSLKKKWIRSKTKKAFRDGSVVSVIGRTAFIKGFEGMQEGELLSVLKKDRKVEVLMHSNCIKKQYSHARRLRKAWMNAVVLEYMNLCITPKVFCARLPTAFSTGFILMEDLSKNGVEFDKFLDMRYESMSWSEKVSSIKAFSLFFSKLIKNGIYHKDLKGCNIFVAGGNRFYLLDIEDIGFKEIKLCDIVSMLTKLNNTIPKRVSLRMRARFLLLIEGVSKDSKVKIWKRIVDQSKGAEIVYEGEKGLGVDRWEGK